MRKWILTKLILGYVNGLLEKYKSDVSTVRGTLILWIARLETVANCFKSFLQKLDDGKLDETEVDETMDSIGNLVKNW